MCVYVCVYGDIQALIVCGCVFQHTSTSCFHTKPDIVMFAGKSNEVGLSGLAGWAGGYIKVPIIH